MKKITKTHTTITIDPELLTKSKRMGINISGALQEYLQRLIVQKEEDLDGINLELLSIEIVRLQNSITQNQSILSSKIKLQENILRKAEEAKQQELEEQKERIEESKKCLSCGKILEEDHKKHKFDAGVVCNGCYLAADPKQIGRWMNGDKK